MWSGLLHLRFLAATTIFCSILAFSVWFGASDWLDGKIIDARFATSERAPTGQTVLVDIDAKSLADIGIWPWPRRLHAQVLDAANRAGAKAIAFDIDFSSRANADDDRLFADALSRSSASTLLASFAQRQSASSDQLILNQPIDVLSAASWPVLINVSPAFDGRIRQFPFGSDQGDEPLTSMPSELAGRAETTGSFGIDFGINASQLSRISYVDLLNQRVNPELLRGKNLIVGATAIELHDLFRVPILGNVSGSTVIALATETLLQKREIIYLALPLWAVVVGVGIALVVLPSFNLRRTLWSLLGASFALETGCFWVQRIYGIAIPSGGLHIALCTVAIGLGFRELGVRRVLLWITNVRLHNQETILSRIIEDGFDGVVLLDQAGSVLRANRHASLMLGLKTIKDVGDLPNKMVELIRSAAEHRLVDVHLLQQLEPPRILEYSVSRVETADIDAAGELGDSQSVICVAIRDVTEREQAAENMRFLACHDSLTGLPNRRGLELHLAEVLGDLTDQKTMCLISFDLDRFKLVNDTLGHTVGDGLLREVAARASSVLSGSFIARLGGDEFFALVDKDRCAELVDALRGAVQAPSNIMGHTMSIGISVGIADVDKSCAPGDLLRHADLALYRAKAGPGISTFDASMETERQQRLSLEGDLLKALARSEFRLVFQPQVQLNTGDVVGAEALLRWHHPERGPVSPAIFIPVAEEMGLVRELGEWVLQESCRIAAAWPKPLKIAVNVSPIQFAAGGLVRSVSEALRSSGLAANRLELEITESVFVQDSTALLSTFDELLKTGVTFALDDFGTGYSSLGYLQRFPISKVKIDQSFVRDIGQSSVAMAVLRAVQVLAAGLKIRTIAEGVETVHQSNLLQELGYHEAQGYLFSKPLSVEDFARVVFRSGMADDRDSRAA